MSEPAERLYEDIQGRIVYFGQEYDISTAEAIGVLQMLSTSLIMEARKLLEDDDDDDGEDWKGISA